MSEQGETIPPQEVPEVIETSRSFVTLDQEKGTVRKIFKFPEDPGHQPQIEILKKILEIQGKEGPVPGFPPVLKIVEESGKVVGYEQKLIEGKSLREFLNERKKLLSVGEAEKLFLTLARLEDLTGHPHGDLGEGSHIYDPNLLVTEDQFGQPEFYFIDYGGTADYNIPNTSVGATLKDAIDSERSMLLSALFIGTVGQKPNQSTYVEGPNEERLNKYKELYNQYIYPRF